MTKKHELETSAPFEPYIPAATKMPELTVRGVLLGTLLGMVFGAEGPGLRRLTREICDRSVRIPMLGSVESLNVSVAAGVCLYEVQRQRLTAK